MSRNALGARLPPSDAVPKILPDGSKSQHHGGSFHAYMAHKNRKLQEQFQAHADSVPGQQRTHLFEGVSIHVNGFTQPSHLELKQIMALHGGRFENYYSRTTVTHIICSNLPDAKVKQLQRERSPTPVVRPEWIVDSISAGHVLPIEGYALWQLRDAPGQQRLKEFVQVRPAGLPPAAIYGNHAGAVGSTLNQLRTEAAAGPEAQPTAVSPAPPATELPSAAQDRQQESPPAFNFDVQRQQDEELPVDSPPGGLFPQAPQQPHNHPHQQQQQQEAFADFTFAPHGLPSSSLSPQHVAPISTEAPPQRPASALAASALPSGGAPSHGPASSPASAAAHPSMPADNPAAGPSLGGRAVSPAGVPAEDEGLRYAQAGYDAAEMQLAHQIASRMRAECDMLKGPPRSSKDDPEFVDSFFKASRLHYIGTYKSRIEALMASSAGTDGPSPAPHTPGRPRTIMHLDMDCFFAAVAEANNPIFKSKPLAVCHSASSRGTGEVSTCNYEARKYGVRSGMMISEAKELCPCLLVVPYMFEEYAAVSEKVYRILLRCTACIQPLSCDEAYLDITGLGDPLQIAGGMRAEIEATTGCTASAGIGPNLLLARIATESAKPNGQRMVTQQEALQFLQGLKVSRLPGVGWATQKRLAEQGIHTVADVQARSKQFLQAQLGEKQGAMLWDFAHGKDRRQVEPPRARKSVGAEVNWGVRFQSVEESREFLQKLAVEVQDRMRQARVKGRTFTLKLMRRKQNALEPRKHMGHGECDNLSRSVTLARFTDSSRDIFSSCWDLLCTLKVPFADIRGMGITASRLNTDPASASARPGSAPPAKLAAPPASGRDPFAAFRKPQHAQQPPLPLPQQSVLPQQDGPEPQPSHQRPPPAMEQEQQQEEQQDGLEHQQASQQQQQQLQQLQQLPGLQKEQCLHREQPLLGRELQQAQDKQQQPVGQPAIGQEQRQQQQIIGEQGQVAQQAVASSPLRDDIHEQEDVQQQQQLSQQRDEPENHKVPHQAGRAGSPLSAKRSPKPARQAALELLVQRRASSSREGPVVESPQRAKERQRLVQQWQGVSLSQMDASALAALPWSVQKELVAAVSTGRLGHYLDHQEHHGKQQLPPQHAGQSLAGSFDVAAAASEPTDAPRPQQTGPGAAVQCLESPQIVPAAKQLPAQQADGAARPQISSSKEDGWHSDSQPEVEDTLDGSGGRVTAADSSPALHQAAPQHKQVQQTTGAEQALGRLLDANADASGSGAGGAATTSSDVGMSGVVPLPALSQVDRSVLEALPLQLRRELERAYGIGRPTKRPLPGGSTSRRAGRGGTAPAAAGAGASSLLRHVSKRQRLDSFVATPPPMGVTGSGRALAAAVSACHEQHMSLSQVDPSVLAELPSELQQEVVQQLQQGSHGQRAQQQRSRLGQQHNEEQAWKQRWEEERTQRRADVAYFAAVDVANVLASQEDRNELEKHVAFADFDAPQAAVQQFLHAEHAVGAELGPSLGSSFADALAGCLQQLEQQLTSRKPSSPLLPQRAGCPKGQDASDGDGNSAPTPSSRDPVEHDSDGRGNMGAKLPSTQPGTVGEPQLEDAGRSELAAGADHEQCSVDARPQPQGGQQNQPPVQQLGQRGEPAVGDPHLSGDIDGLASQALNAEAQQGLQALSCSLQNAVATLLSAHDLEQLRLLLRAVQRLGQQYAWFASGIGSEFLEAAQERVQKVYGWRLRLAGMELDRG